MQINYLNSTLVGFLEESNRIEGIFKKITEQDLDEFCTIISAPKLTIKHVQDYVWHIQPNAVIRTEEGANVRVGNHYPPKGGKHINKHLQFLLDNINSFTPYEFHCLYETLHPFTDGNGRSGRAIWFNQMFNNPSVRGNLQRGFLHEYYYQSLSYCRKDNNLEKIIKEWYA
jgi:hypothetical protein